MRRESSSENGQQNALWVPVTGDSMWPSLRAGDAVRVVPCAGPLVVGNVVVFRGATNLVVHRVISTGASLPLLQGDNVATADPEVTADRIVGIVTQVKRGGRVLENWDVGPRRAGRARLWLKRGLASLLRGVRA